MSAERENLADITRQALIIGTSCITDPTGNIGYKTEMVQASALIRIAESLERQELRAHNIDPAMFLGEVPIHARHFEAFAQVVAQYNEGGTAPRQKVVVKGSREIKEHTLLVRLDFVAPEDIWALARRWEKAIADGTVTAIRTAQEGGQADD